METFDLASLVVGQGPDNWTVSFSRARLNVISDYGTRQWYVDADGVADERLLHYFAGSADINVTIQATTVGGRRFAGQAFFHPNTPHRAVTIRGDGQLLGY